MDDRLVEIIDELQPDVIVEDNVVSFPAIPASGRPWVRIVSCNPTEVKDPELAPTFSGLPDADRGDWAAFREEYARAIEPLWGPFDEFCRERGAPTLPAGELIHTSDYLNLYVYPRELDYDRAVPLGPTWHRLESSVRTTEESWSAPAAIAQGDGALVYLSLGSLGSADVPLMRDLVEKLGSLPHRFVVSRGPQHTEYELADNMAGEEFLPQTSVLPEVDVVITHAGNNTTTECMHFGKPMIAMPLFWDQHDNAQRIDETGFGARLATYGASAGELGEAIGRLAADEALAERMAATARRLQAEPGTERAAELIDRLARSGEPVLREG